MPDYFARYKPLVADWDAFQAAVQRPLPTTIWTNPTKTDPETLRNLLPNPQEAQPLPWLPGAFRLPPDFPSGLHWTYMAGLYHVQEEVSLLPIVLLDPQPGERVLDLCAAPGNKTAQISLAMRNSGTVVANDRNMGRMRAMRHTLDRLGLYNVTTTIHDGSNFSQQAGPFDKILVDVPCTCEGTCRKDHTVFDGDVNSQKLVGTQRALLRKAVQLCRPGGRIVYATCTFAPEENELIVDAILREYSGIVKMQPAVIPGFNASPGVTHWQGQTLDESLHHALRVWPHQNDSGGFFVAVLQKLAGTPAPEMVPSTAFAFEREPWLSMIGDHYGIDPAQFSPYHLIRWSRKRLYLVNHDHQTVSRPQPDAVGMFFMHVDGKYPKLTTGAAQLFGRLATRHVVDLDAAQAQTYLARQDFGLLAQQAATCDGTGYVLVRYQGMPLGIGVYRVRQGFLESLFPKGWARIAVV